MDEREGDIMLLERLWAFHFCMARFAVPGAKPHSHQLPQRHARFPLRNSSAFHKYTTTILSLFPGLLLLYSLSYPRSALPLCLDILWTASRCPRCSPVHLSLLQIPQLRKHLSLLALRNSRSPSMAKARCHKCLWRPTRRAEAGPQCPKVSLLKAPK